MNSSVEGSVVAETFMQYLDEWSARVPEKTWLHERRDNDVHNWSWSQGSQEIDALAAWQEKALTGHGHAIGLLSRNCAHWIFADMGSIAAGNVVIPLFCTLSGDIAEYIMSLTEMKILFVGETDNWEQIRQVLPRGIKLITLPGVTLEEDHLPWEEVVASFRGHRPAYRCQSDDLVSVVFTSGTTGLPKGVMQTHDSNIIPINRFTRAFNTPHGARLFSYLPLSHIAERQIVEGSSIVNCAEIYLNEKMATLLRDLRACRPHMMFGPPRVWEQLQQQIVQQWGSQGALDKALAADREKTGQQVQEYLGLDQVKYILTAASPTPPALIGWYENFGIILNEGFGQTECMGPIVSSTKQRRIGSVGKPMPGVEVRLSDERELLVKAPGCSPGYYKEPERTVQTFVDGWVHTGDKARVDRDGFYYITGRMKDYFKTIHGKFVAPTPIENMFAESDVVEQLCLLGRGYSKTVMICVLGKSALEMEKEVIEANLLERVGTINKGVEKHARVGGVIISIQTWTIDNGLLTPTLKIRRDKVEERFGSRAQRLARSSAESGAVLLDWVQNELAH